MLLPAVVLVALAWQTSVVTQPISEISGTVEQIDRAGRLVTIRSTDGVPTPIYVEPDLPVFDQLERGDRVTIRFYDSYIVEVTPRARMKPVEDTTADAQKKRDPPEAAILQQLRLVVTIDEIDRNNNTVTYHDVTNRRVLRSVQHPKLLEELKVGDVVTITYTRARAASIEKRR
jgi:hypothetical protein